MLKLFSLAETHSISLNSENLILAVSIFLAMDISGKGEIKGQSIDKLLKQQSLSRDIYRIEKHAFSYLDDFFLKRLTKEKHNLFKEIRDIERINGLINKEIYRRCSLKILILSFFSKAPVILIIYFCRNKLRYYGRN